ncbi:MAG: type II-A CRISPR-associated protein Csn2 [Treponemataceae bacterium]
MKIIHPDMQTIIEFEENKTLVLVIENPPFFRRFIQELHTQMIAGEGNFLVYQKNEPAKLNSCCTLIVNPINLDFNPKQISNAILKKVKECSVNEKNYTQTLNVNSFLMEYINTLIEDIDYPLSFSKEIDSSALFKIFNLKIEPESEDFLEQLCDYMKAFRDILNITTFIFANLKSYLLQEDLQLLYEYSFYEKINLFLIESTDRDFIKCEKKIIIDADLCEL